MSPSRTQPPSPHRELTQADLACAVDDDEALAGSEAEDAGGDVVFLPDRDKARSVDEVQRLAVGEFSAARAVPGRGDNDAQGRALVLHRAVQVAGMGRRG